MNQPMFPVPIDVMRAKLAFEDFVAGESFTLDGGVTVRTAPLNHPNGATGYRLELGGRSVCYVTDTEHILGPAGPERPRPHRRRRPRDLRLHLHGRRVPGQGGLGPLHVAGRRTAVPEGGARRLAIFHHDPDHDDSFMAAVDKTAARRVGGSVRGAGGDGRSPSNEEASCRENGARRRPGLAGAAIRSSGRPGRRMLPRSRPSRWARAAPDFDLPGVDGRRYSLKDFAAATHPRGGLHLQPLPDGPGLRGAHPEAPRRLREEGRRRRRHLPQRPQGGASRRARLHRPRRLPRGHEDPRQGAEVHLPLPLRRRDPGRDPEVRARWRRPTSSCSTQARKLRFVGRIDDAENPAKTKVHDTRDAIDALLAGQPVPVEKTKVFGCSIKWADKGELGGGGPQALGRRGGRPRPHRRRGPQGPGQERLDEAAPHQRVGHLVRPLRHRVPGPRHDQPHVPGARLRGRDRERRSAREARRCPRLPEGEAGLHPELRVRDRRPLRDDRRGGRRVAGGAAPHHAGGARAAR